MNQLLGKRGFQGAMVLVAALSLSVAASAAEKRELTYVKNNYRTASKTSVTVGEGHEITQEMVIGDIKYSSPDFKPKEEWSYTHSDVLNGVGKDSGYYIDTHEDGSRTYGVFEGMRKLTTKSDGSWELTWEGTYKYVGGTGRYKNIKGNGRYKGIASPADPGGTEHGQETVEY